MSRPRQPTCLIPLAAVVACGLFAETVHAQRAIGIDVSYWQGGAINWATVAKPQAQGGGGINFAFIRATRGGTIGTYDQSARTGTGSQRYDDPYTARNVAGAKANGILAGVYHYARIDLIHNTDANFPGYTGNTGLDEANHFLEMASQYMTPGHLRPVIDVEAGANETGVGTAGAAVMGAWVKQFSDRILAATGVRPIVYINTSYATDEIDASVNIHDLWLARYLYVPADAATPEERAAFAAQAQTIAPPKPSGYSTPYGVFKTTANPVPWDFWQYTSDGRTPGISGAAVDQNVANGDVEYVKEFLVPALWMPNANGNWTAGANWNAQGALPTAADRTIIDRPGGDYLITLSSGSQAVRSLQLNERLTIAGGSLAATQYVNVANTLSVTSGALSADAIANTATLNQSGGTVIVNAVTGTGTISVSGGTLRARTIKQNGINISGGLVKLEGTTAPSVIKSVSVSGSGVFDIADAALIFDYSGSTPLATLRAALQSAYADGTWAGPGITSSTLGMGEGVALLETTQLFTDFTAAKFRGERVDSTGLILVRAMTGDTDLDGSVDFDDLLALAKVYNGSGTWRSGDANFDGLVSFDDLLALAKNYNRSGASPDTLAAMTSQTFASDFALAQSLVPEPAVMSALGLAGCPIGRRRRRRET